MKTWFFFLTARLLLSISIVCLKATSANEIVRSTVFFSRPDLNAPTLNISLHDPRVDSGYIFTSPYFQAHVRPDSGPYIFDNSGTLIWSGVDDTVSAGISDAHGLHVCHYQGDDHLCLWKGRQRGIHGSGIGVIINRHYQIVKTIRNPGSIPGIDLHEFRLTSKGTALVTVYQPRFHGSAWILDSIFREIDLDDGQILFEWSALQHVGLSESHVPRGSYDAVGDGLRNDAGWDYFHLNSVEKNEVGDYLISSRHTDCVFLVSGLDGSIKWRLNGDNSSFKLEGFTFRRQHHVRFRQEAEARTVISLFDNENDGFTVLGSSSTGMVIEIDHVENVARKLIEFRGPEPGGLVTDGMGSLSYLAKDHVLVSWGQDSAVVEYLPDGTPAWYANIGWRSRNYRTYKANWVGMPLTPPALWVYAASTTSPMVLYMSWNGATEVRSWRLYTSQSQKGPFQLVGSQAKLGFETEFSHDLYRPWTFVEAMGENGSLGNSTVVETFLPEGDMMRTCGLRPCSLDTFQDITIQKNSQRPVVYRHYWAAWRILEHLMAVIGTLTCLALGIWCACKSFKRSIPYHRLRSIDF